MRLMTTHHLTSARIAGWNSLRNKGVVMALKVNLALEPAARGEYMDRFYAQEGDWHFEVQVPKGERPTTVDVHFEFDEKENDGKT